MPKPSLRFAERFIDASARCPRGWLATLPYRGSHGAPRRHEEVFAALLGQLGPVHCHQVLDIGCGGGRLIELMLNAEALHVFGLDHSTQMLEIARKRNRAAVEAGRVALKHGNAHSIPWPDDSFSVVVSANMFFFLAEPRRALRECSRVLRSDGRLAIATIRGPLPARSVRNWWVAAWGSALHVYDDPSLSRLISGAGFRDVRIAGEGQLQLALASRPCTRTASG